METAQLLAALILVCKATLTFSATLSTDKQQLIKTTGIHVATSTDFKPVTAPGVEKGYQNVTTVGYDDSSTKKLQNHTGEIQPVTMDPDLPQFRIQRMVHSIHLVWLNVEHVKYPMVFTLVVLFAALSKIGKGNMHMFMYTYEKLV